MEALSRANHIRVRRAQLKRDLKAGRVRIGDVIADPPDEVLTAKVYDMLSEHAAGEPIDALHPVTTATDIENAIAAVKGVFVEESLHRYVVAILNHTRAEYLPEKVAVPKLAKEQYEVGIVNQRMFELDPRAEIGRAHV